MTTETDMDIELKHPVNDDPANGRYIEWGDEDQFLIFSWYHWNGKDFGGTLTTWTMSDWDIQLVDVFIKERGASWKQVARESPDRVDLIPDRHKRIAREIGRERFKLTQFYRLVL